MKKPIVTGVLAISLFALPLAGVATAQQTGGEHYQNQAEQTARDIGNQIGNRGGGGNWGWLGLIGLVGLAGLRGRHTHESAPRHPFRRDEPVGSR